MLVSREDVLKFIPQRPPIVVVHGLVTHGSDTSVSEFLVEEDHLFVRDGQLLPSGLMENIAQTCALSSGYQFSLKMQESGANMMEPPIGFIGALKNFAVNELPAIGSVLKTRVKVLHEVMGMQVVEAEVTVDTKPIASCEMKIFLQQENQEPSA